MKKINKSNPTLMYYLFTIIQGIVGILPIGIYVLCNYEAFFGTKTSAFSNTLGIIIACIFVALIFTKQMKFLKGIGGFLVFAIIVTLMRTIISQLYMISWMAVLGMLASMIISALFTDKYKRLLDSKPTTDALNNVAEKITTAINGRG